VGTQASLCLCAPILRHRPRVLDQSGTVLIALLPKTFEHHHSASPADLHRLSLDVGVCRHAVLKPTIVLPVARRANEEAITGLHLVDDDKKYRVAVFAVTGLFFARQAASLCEKQSPRNVSHRGSASCVASDLSVKKRGVVPLSTHHTPEAPPTLRRCLSALRFVPLVPSAAGREKTSTTQQL
jgi:hypothetical protein